MTLQLEFLELWTCSLYPRNFLHLEKS